MYANTRLWLGITVSILTFIAIEGCNRNQEPDPAAANLAPANLNAAPENQYGEPQESYANQQSAQQLAEPPENYSYPGAQQLVEASEPPPPLPEYSQPPCPGDNYIWTPGYWSYSRAGYYWVPGGWVLAPYVDALWTPPYWDYYDRHYRWHRGYWSRHIGFYGGINYGYGYTGLGFYGGYWDRAGAFVYNRAVANVDIKIVHNVYQHSVVNYTPVNRISYNGSGGIVRQPIAAEMAVRREARTAPLPVQVERVRNASVDRAQFAATNHGHPATAVMQHPIVTQSHVPAQAPEARPFEPQMNREGAGPARVQNQAPSRTEQRLPLRPEQGQARPAPAARPQPVPRHSSQGYAAREMPSERPSPFEAQHNQARPMPQRPAPAQAPHTEARPMPQRPAPAQAPHGEDRPMPQRPVPAQAPHTEARPMPQRPAPAQAPRVEARPAPQPEARPASPQAHPAPHPESRPAQPSKKEEHGGRSF